MAEPAEFLYALPLGAVIAWYPPPDGKLPGGFALCDGKPVDDPQSVYHTKPTPNLAGRYVLGSGGGVSPGQTGGDTGYAVTGYSSPLLSTSPTEVTLATDDITPSIIYRQSVSSNERFALASDGDKYHDGNHHHDLPPGAVTVPAPAYWALQYIMRIR